MRTWQQFLESKLPIQYYWTRQVATNNAYVDIHGIESDAARERHKKVMGVLQLHDFPSGFNLNWQQEAELPSDVHIDDGWNGSFHAAQYFTSSLYAFGKHHKAVREKLEQAYNIIQKYREAPPTLDPSAQKMKLRSIVRPGD